MKSVPKSALLLFGLVFTVYLARQSDFSLSHALKGSLRTLASGVRPSESLCVGVDLNDPVSDSQRKRAESIKKSLSSVRGGNPLMEMVEENNDDFADYAVPLVAVIAPWIVFFAISLLVCIGFICNWCCMFGVCKSMSICSCCKEPKKTTKKKIFAAFSLLFLVCVVGSSIAGLTFSKGVPNGMELTLCSFLNVVENLAYGKTQEKWIGITGAVNALDKVVSDFDTTVGGLGNLQTEMGNLGTSLTTAITAAQTLYTTHQGDEVDDPELGSPNKYKPEYIQNLGPETDSTKYTGAIVAEMQAKKDKLATTVNPINTAITDLKTQQSSIKGSLSDGKNAASDISKQMTDILDTLGDNGKTVKDVVKIIGNALTGVFGATLALSIFAITSIVMVGLLKIKFFNKMLHLSWFLIIILTVLGFVLSSLTFPLSVVMLEGCEVINKALNDKTFFDDSMNTFSSGNSQARDAIGTCVFGDGNMLAEFDIVSQIDVFDDIFTNLDKVSEDFDIESNTPPPSIVIPIQKDLVAKFKTGVYIDADKTFNNLIKLNQKVNKNSASCIGTPAVYDTWVLNSVNCTSSMGATYAGASDTFDIPNPTCVGFDQWMTGTHTIANRYSAATSFTGCSAAGTTAAYVQGFVTSFMASRTAVADLFDIASGKVGGDLAAVETAHTTFANNFVTVFQKLRAVRTGMATIQDSLVGETNGIIPNTNCKFIKTDLQLLTDSMCVGFISSLYQTSLVIIITSFFSLFSTIAVFCLAKRFLVKDEKAVSP